MSEWIKRLAAKYAEVNESKFLIPEEIPTAERTAFMGAAAAAHKAGQTHFNFGGKKHKVTMKTDTAKAIADDVKESVEQVDEVSMSKLQNYSKAAVKDIENKRNVVRKAMSTGKKKDYDDAQKAVSGLGRRSKGSDMYTDKMMGRSKVKPTTEEDEVVMNPKKEKKEKAGQSSEVMAQESTIPPVYARILESRDAHYKKASKPEDWDEKEKNNKGAMDMKADHKGETIDNPEAGDQMAKATNAAPSAKARSGDNKAGDKKIIPSATPTKGM